MKKMKIAAIAAACLFAVPVFAAAGCTGEEETIVLRVSNWEEYIDLGGWDDEEAIDIANAYTGEDHIMGVNSVVDDFTEWFNSQDHGFKVRVEYSTFGTNEDLYNQLNLGDVYDLVCPSDYMIMKLLASGDNIQPFSDDFMDASDPENYYINGVSRYIDGADGSIFDQYGWSGIAACYMWGTTGLVYNPERTDEDGADVESWDMLTNADYYKSVTIKDNVRDAYFAALSILYEDELNEINADENMTDAEKAQARSDLLNATDADTIAKAEDILKDIKENVYSFETDSGKADMVTGKVIGNLQWSGDAVYILDQADEEDTELWYSVPDSNTNLWFDGWVMLKDGIAGSKERQTAAEAFVNFLSRPDIAVRNMYYIGYTSANASEEIFEYFDWCYGAVTDSESEDYYEFDNIYVYDVSYFFGEGSYIYLDMDLLDVEGAVQTNKYSDDDYIAGYPVYEGGTINKGRQAFGQYPTADVIDRSVVMLDFGDDLAAINQMWINVRCLDVKDIPVTTIVIVAVAIAAIAAAAVLYRFSYDIFYSRKEKQA